VGAGLGIGKTRAVWARWGCLPCFGVWMWRAPASGRLVKGTRGFIYHCGRFWRQWCGWDGAGGRLLYPHYGMGRLWAAFWPAVSRLMNVGSWAGAGPVMGSTRFRSGISPFCWRRYRSWRFWFGADMYEIHGNG